MQVVSTTIADGGATPDDCALAVHAKPGPVTFAGNRNPHLAWSGAPVGTKSFVITCIDHDCPSAPDDVNQPDREVPSDLPRVDFTHWLLADIPADVTEVVEGSHSDGVTSGGKGSDEATIGVHGVNDYTAWFAGDEDLGGTWHGYDGPAPPWNDSIRHRYEFRVYAVDVEELGLPPGFSREELEEAMDGHVLDSASLTITHATNPRLA
jgi:Raf kinase inhibitor-like YbhB/YbcL family protein